MKTKHLWKIALALSLLPKLSNAKVTADTCIMKFAETGFYGAIAGEQYIPTTGIISFKNVWTADGKFTLDPSSKGCTFAKENIYDHFRDKVDSLSGRVEWMKKFEQSHSAAELKSMISKVHGACRGIDDKDHPLVGSSVERALSTFATTAGIEISHAGTN
jgi:hypothetical protein